MTTEKIQETKHKRYNNSELHSMFSLQPLDLTTSNCRKMKFLDKSDLSEFGQNAL